MLAGGDKAVLKILKKMISRFATTDARDISLMLGMKLTHNREVGTITISQADYTRSVLEKYGMGSANP